MGLWNFLGGNKIGPGHPRYERMIRKQREFDELIIECISKKIMSDGIVEALKHEREEQIIWVLKHFPTCPKFVNKWGKVTWGTEERHINPWKQAQKWLKEKERSETDNPEYVKFLEQKIKDQEERIKEIEKQISFEKE